MKLQTGANNATTEGIGSQPSLNLLNSASFVEEKNLSLDDLKLASDTSWKSSVVASWR